jgi:hypothetical protein
MWPARDSVSATEDFADGVADSPLGLTSLTCALVGWLGWAWDIKLLLRSL